MPLYQMYHKNRLQAQLWLLTTLLDGLCLMLISILFHLLQAKFRVSTFKAEYVMNNSKNLGNLWKIGEVDVHLNLIACSNP